MSENGSDYVEAYMRGFRAGYVKGARMDRTPAQFQEEVTAALDAITVREVYPPSQVEAAPVRPVAEMVEEDQAEEGTEEDTTSAAPEPEPVRAAPAKAMAPRDASGKVKLHRSIHLGDGEITLDLPNSGAETILANRRTLPPSEAVDEELVDESLVILDGGKVTKAGIGKKRTITMEDDLIQALGEYTAELAESEPLAALISKGKRKALVNASVRLLSAVGARG